MRGSFTYGADEVPYRVKFSQRRTLSISVLPDGSVEVVAPSGTPEHEIRSRLRQRARWIARQQSLTPKYLVGDPGRT